MVQQISSSGAEEGQAGEATQQQRCASCVCVAGLVLLPPYAGIGASMALSVTTSKNWTPATRQEPLRERTVSRMQRLRRRLSLGRLSLSKEVILPDADNEQRVTLNGFERVADASQLSPVGEDAPLPPPRTSSSHSGLDRPPPASSVKAGWLRPTPHSSSFDGSSTTERRPVCRPARPKSEVLLSQHKATQAARSPSMLLEGSQLRFGRLEAYVRLEQLGEGSYATVYRGYSNLMGQVVALKEIRLQPEEGTPFTAIREASLLRGLKHANIVTLHDIIHTKDTLMFVFEYVHTDLSQYLEKHPGGLHSRNVKLFLFQLLRGTGLLPPEAHPAQETPFLPPETLKIKEQCTTLVCTFAFRDLKPQNLLISEQGELKLADFGLARAKSVPSRTYSHEVVTLWYRPPDVLLGSTDYSTSLDMWGVGCIFIEMVTGAAAFPGVKDTGDQLEKIWKVLGTPTEATWEGVSRLKNYKLHKCGVYPGQPLRTAFPKLAEVPQADEMANRLLQLRPQDRISASEALHQLYFADLPPQVHQLPDQSSLFTIAACKLAQETYNMPLSVMKAAAKLRC
ncbi:hypothetical protein HPB47_026159 [Ixodes persulcatus]|uniref:Uncharacterized protein n=1 Tax=Ixodes persulcatus TaxID=34615 RepID=A0AC60PZF3_IXOPE|nr:hypothetical protein HPB47_026159 [Ixodes persulcatus]